MTGSRPEASARPAVRLRIDSPSNSRNILFLPILVEAPAARTIPATRAPVSGRMNGAFLLAQGPGLTGGVNGEDLGDDRERHLFRSLGSQVQAHRGEDPIAGGRPDLGQDLGRAGARAEQADVRNAGREHVPRPFTIVTARGGLDH